MHLDIDIDNEDGQVSITYDDQAVLKVLRDGDGPNDFTFKNFEKVEDENVASALKQFAKQMLLV